jgi:hypothetical protein
VFRRQNNLGIRIGGKVHQPFPIWHARGAVRAIPARPRARRDREGFTLSVAKQVLTGKIGDASETIEHNVRSI